MTIAKVQPSAVHEQQIHSGNLILIDVREEEEFAEVAAPYARNFPLSSLDPDTVLEGLQIDRNNAEIPLYFICAAGMRSHRAAEMFQQMGYPHVYNVTGGMHHWKDCGLPLRG